MPTTRKDACFENTHTPKTFQGPLLSSLGREECKESIYFLGICGTAMGNVAQLFKAIGYTVSGADTEAYPPMSTVLQASGISLYEGYNSQRLEQLKPDLVVIGNAISRGNAEVEWLLESRQIPFCSLPDLIHHFLLKKRKNIVVSGTHGKTTVATLIAFLLQQIGQHPGYLIGGVPLNLPSGSAAGNDDAPFVIEGDEYDSAFFDKRSKFIHYLPNILIINNIEFDHGDIFRDLEDVKRSFNHLLKIVPRNGYILINGDDPVIESLFPISWANVLRVGKGSHNDLQFLSFQETNTHSTFKFKWKGNPLPAYSWNLSGEYNARNAAISLLAVGLHLNPQNPFKIDLSSHLSMFQGVKRRQEIIFHNNNLTVIEDFAHHPTAIYETLKGIKSRYSDYSLTVCFEPRSNTMCRKIHEHELPQAFQYADQVFFAPIFRPHLYSDADRLDIHKVIAELRKLDKSAKTFESNDALLCHLSAFTEEQAKGFKKHIVCFLSNGAFGGIIQKFIKTQPAAHLVHH